MWMESGPSPCSIELAESKVWTCPEAELPLEIKMLGPDLRLTTFKAHIVCYMVLVSYGQREGEGLKSRRKRLSRWPEPTVTWLRRVPGRSQPSAARRLRGNKIK
jgi:hypothetical protein